MTETKLKQVIRNIAKRHGFMPITITPPPVGLPDLLLLDNINQSVIFVELKLDSNKLSNIQKHVISKLSAMSYECRVIRYKNVPNMSDMLKSDKPRFLMSDLHSDFRNIIYHHSEITVLNSRIGKKTLLLNSRRVQS